MAIKVICDTRVEAASLHALIEIGSLNAEYSSFEEEGLMTHLEVNFHIKENEFIRSRKDCDLIIEKGDPGSQKSTRNSEEECYGFCISDDNDETCDKCKECKFYYLKEDN